MFDPRSILDAIVKGSGEPQSGSGARPRDDALGSIGDLLKQIAGGDDAPSGAAPRRSAPSPSPRSVQPRAETPAYTMRRNAAFEKYRKGTSTTTLYPEADKAKLSDTGK